MEMEYCTDCQRLTQVALDHSSGDSICTECGLVLEANMIDETAEWRSFVNDDSAGIKDPMRVGAPVNHLLEDGVLGTSIANVGKKMADDSNGLPRFKGASGSSNSKLAQAFGRIGDICERLAVNKVVKDLACDIYKKVHQKKLARDEIVRAACIFIASENENQPRLLKEMYKATGIREKKISALRKPIVGVLDEKQQSLEPSAGQACNYLKRFAHGIHMKVEEIKAAQEMYKMSEDSDIIRRKPKSVVAAIIYVTCQLSGSQWSARDIARLIDMSEGTIKKSYKDLYPSLRKIVPSWFAKEEDIRKLPDP